MIRTVLLLGLAAYVSAQSYNNDPRNAAILTDSRYLNGDGKFGASYTQEDGVQFKEESDPDGTRRGTYSYVDPNGVRKTVSYTAGKHGFQASGDHLPVGPNQVAPTPGYTPLPQYNPPPQPQYQPQAQYRPQPQQYRAPQPQQYRPPPQPQYQPQPQPQQYQPQPQPQYQPPVYRTTTPPPHRFFPPGKLSLNRSPDGFSYTFNKA